MQRGVFGVRQQGGHTLPTEQRPPDIAGRVDAPISRFRSAHSATSGSFPFVVMVDYSVRCACTGSTPDGDVVYCEESSAGPPGLVGG